jgi:hypothetical protein
MIYDEYRTGTSDKLATADITIRYLYQLIYRIDAFISSFKYSYEHSTEESAQKVRKLTDLTNEPIKPESY